MSKGMHVTTSVTSQLQEIRETQAELMKFLICLHDTLVNHEATAKPTEDGKALTEVPRLEA